MNLPKEVREYWVPRDLGKFDRVRVEAVQQRGKWYASMPALHATVILIGETADEAFDAWAKRHQAKPVEIPCGG